MNFLNPFFLLGVLAAALPIIIYLINLHKPQKVAFSTLSFFNELRKSTIRRIRIKQYILLVLRVLAVLALALALARPFLSPTSTGTASSGGPKLVAILIDNSISMSRIGNSGPLIEQAKNIAGRIIRNGTAKDKFLINTTNVNKGMGTGFLEASRASVALDDITVANSGHYTSEKFNTLYQQLHEAPQEQSTIYIISDAQSGQLKDLEKIEPAKQQNKRVSVQLIELEDEKLQNVAVTQIALENQMLSTHSPITLTATVENTGSVSIANQFVSLEVEEELSGQYEISLKPGETKEFHFEIIPGKTGDLTGKIVLEGDEVSYDNTRYFVIRIPESRSVLVVNGREKTSFISYLIPALEAARQTNDRLSFDQKELNAISQDEWNQYDGIILNGLSEIPEYWQQSLRRYVQGGGGLLLIPSEKGDINSYNRFLSFFKAGQFDNVIGEYGSFQSVGKINELAEGHPVMDDIFIKEEDEEIIVDLPSLFYYYHYESGQPGNTFTLLDAANGDPLLTEHRFGEGMLLTSSIGTDPGWSNFPVTPLFAPIYYRTVLYLSSPESGGLQQHKLGKNFEWSGRIPDDNIVLYLDSTEYKPVAQPQVNGVYLTYEGKEWKPGILKITAEDEKFHIAVNQNIMESRFGTLSHQEWEKMLGNKFNILDVITASDFSSEALDKQLNTAVLGKEIWNWFIWLAMLFLIIETLVTRLYKAESIS